MPGAAGRGLRQSMASLHTWVGLLPGWLLYVIFLFGTVAFFQQEISRWMRPELHDTPLTRRALDMASRHLADHAPRAQRWTITLPADRGGEVLALAWKPEAGPMGKAVLDPASGRPLAVRDTKGGFFLYRMHFDLHYMSVMTARLFVSLAALAMLVAILSGVVTHKKIFTEFFLMRFGKGQRSWLDAHNVTAVLALPFHLMMTYTGLATLLFTLMPWAIGMHYPTRSAFNQASFAPAPTLAHNPSPRTVLPLAELVARAQSLTGEMPTTITIDHPGWASASAQIYLSPQQLGSDARPLYLNAATGQLLLPLPPMGGARQTQRWMIDLHAARYAEPVLRWLYALSGLGGMAMVGSGLVLWVVKRRARLPDPARPHPGFRIVERLNIGVIAGAPLGIAVYFLANRLLPLTMSNRAEHEIDALFIAWGAALVWAIGRPTCRAWPEVLGACAVAYALVPLVNALTTPRGLLPSLLAGDTVYVTFDMTMLATATLFAFAAHRLARRRAIA